MKKKVIENIHYYLENGKVVFTEQYHLDRGTCCANKCRHCPYEPKWTKDTKKIIDKDSKEGLIFDKM